MEQSTSAAEPEGGHSRSSVLAAVRSARAAEVAASAAQLRLAAEWAAMHEVDSLDCAAGWAENDFGETVVALGGPGTPLVGEFCVAEFAAALGLPSDSGKELISEAMELVHRLPRIWRRVMAGEVPAWRARRIARATRDLSLEAAGFVDGQIAHVAHGVGPVVLDRLVEAAILRFMPEQAREDRDRAADGRRFVVDHRQVSLGGTSQVYGELDLADALDLDAAVTARAAHLKELGSNDRLDVRRAVAVGELARADLMLDLAAPEPCGEAADSSAATRSGTPHLAACRGRREVVLHVHLSDAALARASEACDSGVGWDTVGRIDNVRMPVTVDQVRAWCGVPDTHVVVKPVVDLAEHVHVTAYEVPDRLAEQVQLRDATCVFPWCNRSARRCDCDHVVAHGKGGATCSCNLATLCRRHHRLKTFTAWSYVVLEPGSYLWRSPHGYRFLRDHVGTRDVSPPGG